MCIRESTPACTLSDGRRGPRFSHETGVLFGVLHEMGVCYVQRVSLPLSVWSFTNYYRCRRADDRGEGGMHTHQYVWAAERA
eukprot:34674-Eustigmatos_ZCMA.PRE.1